MSYHWVLLPSIIGTTYSFLRFNFFNIKSYSTFKDLYISSQVPQQLNLSKIYEYILILCISLNVILSAYINVNLDYMTLFNSTLLLLMLLVTIRCNCTAQPAYAPLAVFMCLTSLLLLEVKNLYQTYILLEVTAYLNLLFLAIYSTYFQSNITKTNTYGLVINFILNFIASIVLFSLLLTVNWYVGYPSWSNSREISLGSILLTSAVLIKLGTGPWLLGNVISYTGYTLLYLLTYTLVSISIVVPLLFNLMELYGSNSLLIGLGVTITLIFITNTLFLLSSLKSLFAYSTSIFLSYTLLVYIL